MEVTINLPHGEERLALTGAAERNLKVIRDRLGVNLRARNGSLRISGENQAVGVATRVLEQLSKSARQRRPVGYEQVLDTIRLVQRIQAWSGDRAGDGRDWLADDAAAVARGLDDELRVYLNDRRIRALTPRQARYLEAIQNHDLTICVGPAGTGKTYLAVASAVDRLRNGTVRKLVLVRPAVEAGEKLGFLPGNMQEKVNPYLRPLLDALQDMMPFEQVQQFMACDLIEIIPLAFMRGRTLNDSLIILDEAQNTTRAQMLMFLTRLGHGSKMIVTGDTSQIDLEDPRQSGLVDCAQRLRRVRGVCVVTLDRTDIVRHSLVQRIVEVYGHEAGDIDQPTPPIPHEPS